MATHYFYFCDYCKNLTETIYIDENGDELCLECWNYLQDDDDECDYYDE